MVVVRLHQLLLLLLLILYPSKLTFSLPDNQALILFKKSLVHNGVLDSWDPKPISNPCTDKWQGVMCINGVVSSLFLQNMSLSGTIDVEALRQIAGLTSIALQNNFFTGAIPEFNKLGALNALYLSSNNFSEEIPDDFFEPMTPLQKLWLENNKFTGKIPDSLMNLQNLTELHLHGNGFSGLIPEPIQPTSIVSLDFSNNNLEGEIPKGFSKFGPKSFADNDKLCGKPLRKQCNKSTPPPTEPPDSEPPATEQPLPPYNEPPMPYSPGGAGQDYKLVIAGVIIGFLIIFIVVAVFYARRKERAHFSMLEKDHDRNNRVVEVHVPESSSSSSQKYTETSTRKSNLSRKSSKRGGGMGDLSMINDDKDPFGLADLMKAAAEVLGNGGLGSSYKAAMANGLTVVVKRIREMNKLGRDTFDAEMRRLGRIKHPNILAPLAYHFRRDEKLVVSEYMPKGSLLFLLHGEKGISHAELNWPTRLNIIKGVANGLSSIHSEFASYELPHGNLKSSNVLLSQDYVPLLGDFAFHPLTNPNHAAQTMFAYKSPEYIQHQQLSPRSDVYCLGILILEVITGKFPSQYLSNAKGGIDVVELVSSLIGDQDRVAELIDPEISANAENSIGMMVQLLKIGLGCTESEPAKRLDLEEALKMIEEIHD